MRRTIPFLLLLIFGLVLTLGVLSQTGEEILQQADKVRFLEADSYVLTVRMRVERPEEEPDHARLLVFFKRFAEEDRVRIEFLEPEAMRGMTYLVVGDAIYLWRPGLIRPLRAAGQLRLFGDASIIDAAGLRFGDYEIISEERVQLEGQEVAIKLELQAQDGAAYQRVNLWVDLDFRPLQALLRSVGGMPLKRVLYRRYDEHEGDELVVEFMIESLLFQEHRTLFSVEERSLEDLPDDLFEPEAFGAQEQK